MGTCRETLRQMAASLPSRGSLSAVLSGFGIVVPVEMLGAPHGQTRQVRMVSSRSTAHDEALAAVPPVADTPRDELSQERDFHHRNYEPELNRLELLPPQTRAGRSVCHRGI